MTVVFVGAAIAGGVAIVIVVTSGVAVVVVVADGVLVVVASIALMLSLVVWD